MKIWASKGFQNYLFAKKKPVIWEGFVDLEKYVIFTGKFFYQQGYRCCKVFFNTALAFNLSCQNNNYTTEKQKTKT